MPIPITDGRKLVMPRYTESETQQEVSLEERNLRLPKQPPPRPVRQTEEYLRLPLKDQRERHASGCSDSPLDRHHGAAARVATKRIASPWLVPDRRTPGPSSRSVHGGPRPPASDVPSRHSACPRSASVALTSPILALAGLDENLQEPGNQRLLSEHTIGV